MSVAEMDAKPAPGAPPRMSLSSFCRSEHHRTCTEMGARCACPCHMGKQQKAEPATKRLAKKLAASAPARAAAPPPRAAPPAKPGTPVVELVKAEPPVREPKRKPSLAEMVRPLLEEILVDKDRDWFRVVLFFKANQANFNIKKLRDAHSKTEWEWRAVKLDEVGQSAIYVRWVGKTGILV